MTLSQLFIKKNGGLSAARNTGISHAKENMSISLIQMIGLNQTPL